MKKAYILAVITLGVVSPFSVSADGLLNIPQVSKKPVSGAAGDAGDIPVVESPEDIVIPEDHQAQVLSNPTISDFARAQAAINNSGGNVAIINQSGTSNSSSITQSGDNNYAVQTQKGEDNDIYLDQRGNNNVSNESQTGKHSHKVITQNGNTVESQTSQ